MTQSHLHRLSADPAHLFSGASITRERPITFSFNGQAIKGYEGDTVLSALLAAGYEAAGEAEGAPLALNSHFSPLAVDVDAPLRIASTLDRLPAQNGARFKLLERTPMPLWQKLLHIGHAKSSLGIDCTRHTLFAPPLLLNDPPRITDFDLVVVGAGLAGMSAALEAAKHGDRVALIERRILMGGNALLFGNRSGEPDVADEVERLSRAIAGSDAISVFVLAEALAASKGELLVQFGKTGPNAAKDGVAVLAFKRMVLATGCTERLPWFAGNRLPGTTGLSDAFYLAHAFGVWPGKQALICGGSNLIYRLGMLAHDAGVRIEKLGDPRLDPRSRFLDFSKAYGLRMEAGVRLRAVQREGARLVAELGPVDGGISDQVQRITVDRLIATDGWLPRLGLWRQAGGSLSWSKTGRLAARGSLGDVALAGSAAGYSRAIACANSGVASVRSLLGHAAGQIEDDPLPEIYESREAPMTPKQKIASGGAVFLTRDQNLLQLSGLHPAGPHEAPRSHAVKGLRGPLSISGLDALCRLGVLSGDLVDKVARERHLAPKTLRSDQPLAPASNGKSDRTGGALTPPEFLAGRFGIEPEICRLTTKTQLPECGALIFANSNPYPPDRAVGVVLGVDEGRTVALLHKSFATPNRNLIVRTLHGPLTAQVAPELSATEVKAQA